ncbi:hypothetical protein [Streptomyces sp. MAI_2237]
MADTPTNSAYAAPGDSIGMKVCSGHGDDAPAPHACISYTFTSVDG